MSIISISRDTQNNVSIVRMISTDNLATVAGANYIANQMTNIRNLNSGFWQWYSSDIIACSASDGNAFFIFTDSTFSTLNEYSGMGVTPAQIQDQAFTYAVDSGAANAYVVNLSPAPSSYHDGMYVAFNAANANSGASTINVNSLGAQSIVDNSNTALSSGAILAGGDYLLVYNSGFGAFVLINSSASSGGVTAAQIQKQAFTYAQDSGGANTYVVTLNPAPSAYVDGMYIAFNAINANTGASTINVNSLGATPIVSNSNTALPSGAILGLGDYLLVYNAFFGAFVLINSSASGGGVTAAQIQKQSFTYSSDGGAANAYAITLSPAITSYTDGLQVSFSAANSNTGASTLNVNGLGAINIRSLQNVPLTGGEIVASIPYELIYIGGIFYLLNSSLGVSPAQIQDQSFTYAVATGSANTYVMNLSPAITSYTDGQKFTFRTINANTGASTMNVNGLGAKNIFTGTSLQALIGGEIVSEGCYDIVYSSASNGFYLENPSSLNLPQIKSIQQALYIAAQDTGTVANTYVADIKPVPGGTTALVILQNAQHTNTGASTLDIGDGAGPTPIVRSNFAALTGNEIKVGTFGLGGYYIFLSSINPIGVPAAVWVLLNPSS